MRHIYPAFFYEELEHGYSVIFPDLDVATCGTTLQQAHTMAVDALYCHLSYLIDEGMPLTKPSDIAALKPSDEWEYKSVFSTLVAVDIQEYARFLNDKNKAVRKNVTIPKWMDELAVEKHINFSSVLQDALREQLGV